MNFSFVTSLVIPESPPTTTSESFLLRESPLMPNSTSAATRTWLLNVSKACNGSSIENIDELKKLGETVSLLNLRDSNLKQNIESIASKCLEKPPEQKKILKLVRTVLIEFIVNPGSPRGRTWSS